MKSLISKKMIAGATLMSFLAPAIMFAQTTTANLGTVTSSAAANVPAAFCTNIDVIANQVTKGMMAVKATYNMKRNQGITDSIYKTTDAMVKKATAEAYAQALNNKVYVTLTAKAKTQAQKDALAAFKAVYDPAAAALQSEISLAVTTYKTEMSKILTNRSATFNTTYSVYEAAINTAIAKARTDCNSGVAPATAYSTFVTSVKAANATVAKNSQMKDIKVLVKPLNDALMTSVKAANAKFKNAVQPAYKTLMTTFKMPTTTTAEEAGTVTP